MTKYDNIKNYSKEKFRAVTGVTPTVFNAMLEVVKEVYKQAHKNRGRHRKLSCKNMLLMALEYHKEYRVILSISVYS